MAGGTRSTTAQTPQVPSELIPLTHQSAAGVMGLQSALPLTNFIGEGPSQVAPMTALQQRSLGEIPGLYDLAQRRVTGANLQASPSFQAANRAFEQSIAPGIVNQATLSGLGRSTAVGQGLGAAKAQYLAPLIEAELGREERGLGNEVQTRLAAIQAGLQGGELARGIQQQGYDAQRQDYLRRQALAEQGLFLPFGQLAPSTIGQGSTTRGKSGIFTGGMGSHDDESHLWHRHGGHD